MAYNLLSFSGLHHPESKLKAVIPAVYHTIFWPTNRREHPRDSGMHTLHGTLCARWSKNLGHLESKTSYSSRPPQKPRGRVNREHDK